MPNFIILIIAVSLSMDAFSLSLAYGTLNFNKKSIFNLSLIVGTFHFFMPFLGMNFGKIIYHILPIKPEIIVFVVLAFIGAQMIIETFKEEDELKVMKFGEMFLFGIAVSLDSFSVGIGLRLLTNNIFYSLLTFSITSFLFTYIGLFLGKKISDKVGKLATIIGGVVLIVLGSLYLLH